MKNIDSKILVLGGGGFIGRHVVDKFVKSGAKVSAFDVFVPEIEASNSVNWIVGSTTDLELLRSALIDVDHVIDLAGSEKPGTLVKSVSDHVAFTVGNTLRIAEACYDAGVKSYIYASSGGTVYGEAVSEVLSEESPCSPINYYGVGKLTVEHYLRLLSRNKDFKAIALRLSNPFGEWQRAAQGQGFIAAVFNALSSGETIEIWGQGDTVRDFVYVGDVANAFYQATQYDGPSSIFNIGSGKGRSLNEILDVIEGKFGRQIKRKYLETRSVDVKRSILDISLAKREMNWCPETEFGDAIVKTGAWWKI